MRGRAIKDWCVCGLWLAVAACMFFAALVPAESASGEPDCRRLAIRLVPDNPRPGDTVRVRIGIAQADNAPRAPGQRCTKWVGVDGGMLSAVRMPAPGSRQCRITGSELEGALSCVEWQLPDEPGVARIEVRVGRLVTKATVQTFDKGSQRAE